MKQSDLWPTWPAPFGGGAAPSPTEPWRLTLWWLKSAEDWNLLFGWGFQWRVDGKTGWANPFQLSSHVHRLALNDSWDVLERVLSGLAVGESLEKASARASIQPPTEPFAGLSLGEVVLDGRTASRQTLVAAPWRWLASRGAADGGLQSPLSNAPALRAALVRVDKAALLPEDDRNAVSALAALDADSGLRFNPIGTTSARDIARLGDLEILRFPSATPQISAGPVVSASNQGVTVRVPGLPSQAKALVRCKQSHADAVLTDELIELATDADGSLVARFDASPVGPSGAEIEVWIPSSTESPGAAPHRLWHSANAIFIRQIQMRMSMIEQTVKFDATWLAQWSAKRKLSKAQRARVEAMRTVRRSSRGEDIRVGSHDELWQVAEASARTLSKKLAPPTSGGLFIAARKDVNSDERLAVAEWFRKLVGVGSNAGPVMVIDPYFDDWGLDLVARSEGVRRRFVIVTTTRAPRDDLGRAERLRVEYQGRRALMEGLSVEIFVVPPKRLHDRYVLVLDQDGSPLRGFHLSNSLQTAAQTYPLLITPIPPDTLDSVADSVVEMVATAEPLVLMDDSAPTESVPTHKYSQDELETLAAEVGQAEHFAEAWRAYAVARANTSQPREFGPWVRENGWVGPLADLLETATAPKIPRRPGTKELIGLAQLAALPACELRDLDRVWTHGHRMLVPDWSTRFGYEALLAASPSDFVALMEKDSVQPPTQAEAVNSGFRLHAALDALREYRFKVRAELEHYKSAVCALFHSKSDFVRALGGALLGLAMTEQTLDSATTAKLLQELQPTDRLLVVSDWIGDLRVRANRRRRDSDADEEAQRSTLMTWLRESWPKNATKKLVREVVARCEGPAMGSWAVSTTNELLLPLVSTNRLALEVVADLWLGLLQERLGKLELDDHHFSVNTEAGLSDVCAWLIAFSLASQVAPEPDSLSVDQNTRAAVLQYLKKLDARRKSSARTLARPFVHSLQYTRWDGANRTLAWLEGVAKLVVKIDPNLDEKTLQVWIEVGERLVEPRDEDPSGLFRWLKHIRNLQQVKG